MRNCVSALILVSLQLVGGIAQAACHDDGRVALSEWIPGNNSPSSPITCA
jgi:hypothetical protein